MHQDKRDQGTHPGAFYRIFISLYGRKEITFMKNEIVLFETEDRAKIKL